MGKRFWSLALSVALIGAVFSALPAKAQGVSPTDPPAVVNIDDPFGDANTQTGDNTSLPEDASTVGDIGKVWFTNTAETISLHMQVEGQPPASASNVRYNVYANPVEGKTGTASCLRFEIIPVNPANPGTYAGESLAKVADRCPEPQPGSFYKPENGVIGELLIGTLSDETGVMTATFPRSSLPAFGDGMTISQPFAIDYIGGGTDQVSVPGTPATVEGPFGFTGLRLDDSKVGTDYVISSGVAGGAGSPVTPTEPPGKSDPPGKGKKKGCTKGSGQKKGACPGKKAPKPKPPVNSCAPYTPGEEGVEAGPAVLVTDAATAEKPVETTVEIAEGVGVGGVFEDAMSHAFKNVQVDSASASKGLYVRLEMPAYADYDLYVNNPDGSTAARAAGFNPAPPVYNDTEMGGHTEEGAEVIDGVATADCQGYTVRTSAASGEGGELTLKFWLGEIGYTATPPGQQSAAAMFFGAMKMPNPLADSAQASSTPAADKGCKKGKGKKNGCKKPPVACATFVPGEAGTDKPLVTLTDAATAEAPVEQKVNLDMSVGDLDQTGMVDHGSADFFNVQVDTANPDAGLYVLFEFDARRDYDLNLLHTDGSYAARSRRWNTISESTDSPAPFNISTTGHGGEGTDASELLAGIRTADCGGWTVGAENWLGEGGEFTIKLWLGESKYDPQPPGTETP